MAEVKKVRNVQPAIRILVPMETKVKYDELAKKTIVNEKTGLKMKLDFPAWITSEINEQYNEIMAGE